MPTQPKAITGSSSSFCSNPSASSSALTTSAVVKEDVKKCQDNMEFDNDVESTYRWEELAPEFQRPEFIWDEVDGDSPTMSSNVFSDISDDDSSGFIPAAPGRR